MKKLFTSKLHVLFTIIFAAALGALISCGDSNSEPDKGGTVVDDSRFAKNTYYAVQDTTNGWDEGMYYNGRFIMAHANYSQGTALYYMNDTKSEQSKGILIEYDEDGNVVAFGRPGNLATVCEKDGKFYLSKATGKDEITLAEIKAEEGIASKAVSKRNTKALGDVVSGVVGGFDKGKLIDIFIDFADKYAEKKWGSKVFKPLKEAFEYLDKNEKLARDEKWFQLGANIFATGISQVKGGDVLGVGVKMLAGEYAELTELQHNVFYGMATPEITGIKERTDGAVEVAVTIRNTQTLPATHYEIIVSADGSEKRVSVENNVYCGVLSREGGLPKYNHCDTRSGEILIKTKDALYEKDDLEYSFIIYADGKNGANIRPFLMADLDLSLKPSMKKSRNYIRYGETVPYAKAEVDYTYTLDGAFFSDNTMSYSLKFDAECKRDGNANIKMIRDWGVVILKNGEIDSKISLMQEQDDQGNIGATTSQSTQWMNFEKKDLEITPSSWKATPKDYEIAPYITYAADFLLASSYTSYGVAEPFAPAYIQKPELEFTNAEYSDSYGTGKTTTALVWDDFIKQYRETSVDIDVSVNYCEFKLRGCLFIDSLVVRQSGSGWDKYCLTYLVNDFGQKSKRYNKKIYDGLMRDGFMLEYREDSVSGKDHDMEMELWSNGSKISGNNKIGYQPLKKDNYGANVYHIYGFKAYIKK